MSLKIYNTLTRQKEEFAPFRPPEVGMYVCGITPYDETHIGHGRAYVTFDLIRRYLEHSGYRVKHVQNITDIDDKIIQKAKLEDQSIGTVSEHYTGAYFKVMDQLNVLRASEYPKATEHIPEMVGWIGRLIENGNAYVLEDGVYFDVKSFAEYGKLSGRRQDEQEAGARVKIDTKKRSPLDFSLWKRAKEGEPAWPSPWGEGRPGWHMECSVMSTNILGDQFDIHGGGLDLEFPHHENEIAQTEALTSKVPWVKYWVHNGFVNVNKQKMSKSLGNFFTLKEIFEKYDPLVVRFFFLMTHYRSPINYSEKELDSAREAFDRITKFIEDLDFLIAKSHEKSLSIEKKDIEEELRSFKQKFVAALDDDFNSAGALAAVFEMIKFCRRAIDEGDHEKDCLKIMRQKTVDLCEILGLKIESRKQKAELGTQVEVLIAEREIARKNKDFKRADEIRKQLAEMGIVIEDTPLGPKWKLSH